MQYNQNMNEELRNSIKKTLVYFDLANFPLNREELFEYLWQSPKMNFEHFLEQLSALIVGFAEEKGGYIFLKGREETVERRRRSLLISEVKLKFARRAAKKLRFVPYIKAVFVCNSVGTEQASTGSDIDFFIISAPGRVWIVRFFSNLILRLFGLRTYGQKINDRICLSFFVDEKNLSLADLRIAPDDIHFAYWINQMTPIYNPHRLYSKFLSANSWTGSYLPNIISSNRAVCLKEINDAKICNVWRCVWEKMWSSGYGEIVEKEACKLQMLKMKLSVKEKAETRDQSVALDAGVIKLHEKDSRSDYLKNWLESCVGIK
jgi:hypothetical protein